MIPNYDEPEAEMDLVFYIRGKQSRLLFKWNIYLIELSTTYNSRTI